MPPALQGEHPKSKHETSSLFYFTALLRIRIRRIRMFLGLLDPDPNPLVRGTDPDLSIIKQKY
jgi:hypothetical protein